MSDQKFEYIQASINEAKELRTGGYTIGYPLNGNKNVDEIIDKFKNWDCQLHKNWGYPQNFTSNPADYFNIAAKELKENPEELIACLTYLNNVPPSCIKLLQQIETEEIVFPIDCILPKLLKYFKENKQHFTKCKKLVLEFDRESIIESDFQIIESDFQWNRQLGISKKELTEALKEMLPLANELNAKIELRVNIIGHDAAERLRKNPYDTYPSPFIKGDITKEEGETITKSLCLLSGIYSDFYKEQKNNSAITPDLNITNIPNSLLFSAEQVATLISSDSFSKQISRITRTTMGHYSLKPLSSAIDKKDGQFTLNLIGISFKDCDSQLFKQLLSIKSQLHLAIGNLEEPGNPISIGHSETEEIATAFFNHQNSSGISVTFHGRMFFEILDDLTNFLPYLAKKENLIITKFNKGPSLDECSVITSSEFPHDAIPSCIYLIYTRNTEEVNIEEDLSRLLKKDGGRPVTIEIKEYQNLFPRLNGIQSTSNLSEITRLQFTSTNVTSSFPIQLTSSLPNLGGLIFCNSNLTYPIFNEKSPGFGKLQELTFYECRFNDNTASGLISYINNHNQIEKLDLRKSNFVKSETAIAKAVSDLIHKKSENDQTNFLKSFKADEEIIVEVYKNLFLALADSQEDDDKKAIKIISLITAIKPGDFKYLDASETPTGLAFFNKLLGNIIATSLLEKLFIQTSISEDVEKLRLFLFKLKAKWICHKYLDNEKYKKCENTIEAVESIAQLNNQLENHIMLNFGVNKITNFFSPILTKISGPSKPMLLMKELEELTLLLKKITGTYLSQQLQGSPGLELRSA